MVSLEQAAGRLKAEARLVDLTGRATDEATDRLGLTTQGATRGWEGHGGRVYRGGQFALGSARAQAAGLEARAAREATELAQQVRRVCPPRLGGTPLLMTPPGAPYPAAQGGAEKRGLGMWRPPTKRGR
mmetsp:Transcript_70903/g.160437  ORF Transcript_70903/g.160437 Transcript_70903/m.160437 type:complete len:129 (+) Transcript_70903:1156-1542(+)